MARASGDAPSLDNAVSFLHLGRARELANAGRLDEARQELELARLARPGDPDLLSLVAVVEFRRGDFVEAASATRELLRANPDSPVLHANLGLIQLKAGALEEAEREFERALEFDPGQAKSRHHLGLLRKMRGEPAVAPPSPPPAVMPPAAREAEDRPLFRVRDEGALEVASRDRVYVRKGSVVWASGRLKFAEEPAFGGTKLDRLVAAEGRGDLLLFEPGRRAVARDAGGQSLRLEASRVLALSAGLRFRLEPILDFRTRRRIDILKVHGRGGAVFALAGPLEAHDVSPDSPFSVSSRNLVAWTGDLAACPIEDRYLDEIMLPDPSNAPKLRFEGEGVVLTEGPKRNL